jgi:hypothetical protein
MKHHRFQIVPLFILLVACGSPTSDSAQCVEGEINACHCASGSAGMQTCEGDNYSACSCAGPGSSGAQCSAGAANAYECCLLGGGGCESLEAYEDCCLSGTCAAGSAIACLAGYTTTTVDACNAALGACNAGESGSGSGTEQRNCTGAETTTCVCEAGSPNTSVTCDDTPPTNALCCETSGFPSSGSCECTAPVCYTLNGGCFCEAALPPPQGAIIVDSCTAPSDGTCCMDDSEDICVCIPGTCSPNGQTAIPSCSPTVLTCNPHDSNGRTEGTSSCTD